MPSQITVPKAQRNLKQLPLGIQYAALNITRIEGPDPSTRWEIVGCNDDDVSMLHLVFTPQTTCY